MARRVARILNNIWEQQIEYLLQNFATLSDVNYTFSMDFLSKLQLAGNAETDQALAIRDLQYL